MRRKAARPAMGARFDLSGRRPPFTRELARSATSGVLSDVGTGSPNRPLYLAAGR